MTATAKTTYGVLRGLEERGVHAFLGIQYAAPPVGPRRYAAPERPARWDGERPATRYGAVCLQQRMPGVFGALGSPAIEAGDDCLSLNVWTPDPGGRGLPVLLWIHGGAFYGGSGTSPVYNGAAFARDGVVCVTINYRLGAQGFCHLAEHFPALRDSGNAGLLDQIAALQWVQENIAAFGGDPGNVTIAGESAGGMSVGTLLATPRARGLFRRAVAQSGAAHNAYSAATAARIAGHLVELLGVKPGDLQALLAVPPERVLEVQSRLSGELAMSRDRERFGDAVGSPILLQPTFDTDVLPRCPIAAIAQGAAAGIDLLVGTTTEEAKIFMVEMKGLFNEPVVEALLDRVMRPAGRSGRDVLSLYQQNRPGALPFELAAAAETDRLFRIPALRLADAQAAHHPGTWMYEFAWRSTARGGEFGACHFLEVPFMFDQLDNEQARGIAGTPPQELADKLHPAWVAFAKTGDPHHAALPAWPRWDSERRPALRFDIRCEVVCDTASEERKVWDGVL